VYNLCARWSSKPGGPAVTTGIPPRLRPARSLTLPRRNVAYRPLERSVWAVTCSDARLAHPKRTVGAVGLRTLESLSRCARTRSAMLGPSARPVAIPDDADAPDVVKAHGVIELPPPGSPAWSAPSL
jgi:hypothetical protein